MSLEGKDIVNACKRQPVLAICLTLCALMGLLLYFRMGAVDELQTSLDERGKVQRKLSANVKNAANLEEETASLRAINETIRSNTLMEGALAGNQEFFLRLEPETGVKLVDLRPLPVPAPAKGAPAGGYVPLGFSLSATGNYQTIITFLKRLESGDTLARLGSASAAFGENPEAEQTLALTVEVLGRRK